MGKIAFGSMRRMWKFAALGVGFVLTAYTLFACFVVPRIIRNQIIAQAKTLLHREAHGLPGACDLETPRFHQLHHARNVEYIDCNYSGFLILWDRFFGTYRPPSVEPLFGVTQPISSWSSGLG
jgi:sterol desaturase/sphingolipid hydroxylase (fatty acid hydroxylase superfamily)